MLTPEQQKKIEAIEASSRRYQLEPWTFVKEQLGAKPSWQQMELLKAVAQPGAHVTVKSGHGTGKTTTLAWLILWFVGFFHDCKIPCTAPAAHQLFDNLWPEIKKWHGNIHSDWLRNSIVWQNGSVYVPGKDGKKDTQFAVARTARKENPDALQGMHATNMLYIVDEASGVPQEIFQAAEGALSTPNARIVMTGNPTRLTGYFYDSHHKDREHWTCLHFNGEESPLVTDAYINKMAKKWGKDSDQYRVRVLGEFPRDSLAGFFYAPAVREAYGKELHPSAYERLEKVVGLDLGGGGDQIIFTRRHGLKAHDPEPFENPDTVAIAERVVQIIKQWRPDAVFIDRGYNPGVVHLLESWGYGHIVTGVNFGGSSGDPDYANKRAEMYGRCREWINSGGSIPEDPQLLEEFLAIEVKGLRGDAIVLESKDDIRDKLQRSPDRLDSLVLTFAFTVAASDIEHYEERYADFDDQDDTINETTGY